MKSFPKLYISKSVISSIYRHFNYNQNINNNNNNNSDNDNGYFLKLHITMKIKISTHCLNNVLMMSKTVQSCTKS